MIEFRPIEPAVFTSDEAAAYLRLDVGKTPKAARASLDRLVDDKKLIRPVMYRKERLFTREELDRFLRERTENYE